MALPLVSIAAAVALTLPHRFVSRLAGRLLVVQRVIQGVEVGDAASIGPVAVAHAAALPRWVCLCAGLAHRLGVIEIKGALEHGCTCHCW